VQLYVGYTGSTLLPFTAAMTCRAALEDAQELAEYLQTWWQQQQQQQQQQHRGEKKQFGDHTAEFGALLDMPSSWWATFPCALRRHRQQQQQQQQQQMDVD
jgi:flavin-dependent dehydrogenase